jgi:hypothetical protein
MATDNEALNVQKPVNTTSGIRSWIKNLYNIASNPGAVK